MKDANRERRGFIKTATMAAAVALGAVQAEASAKELAGEGVQKPTATTVEANFEWASFLQRNDIVWDKLPLRFDHGAFHGNGLLGCMIYKDGPNSIRWEMGRSDVTAHRRDNNRLPIGGMVLETIGTIQKGTMRLDLWNAESRGKVVTDKGSISFRTYIHAIEIAMVVEIECSEGETGAKFKWLATPAVDVVNNGHFKNDPPNPPSKTGSDGDISMCIQERHAGGEFATAWKEADTGNLRRLYLSISDTFPHKGAAKTAAETVKKVVAIDPEKLVRTHRDWWHNYYPSSFLSVPDAKVEGFYWAQMYKLACATRKDRMVMDLLGPWYRNTDWPRIWWNLNLQIAYLLTYSSNHFDEGESLVRMLDRNRKNFYKNALDIYKLENAATVPHTTCYDGLRGDGSRAPDYFINPGDFTWALHNYYLHYRYSMNHSMVTDHEKHAFYPLLRDSVNIYLHMLKKGDDGKLHLPKLHSPEYGSMADNNYNLSLLRWACKTLVDLSERYKINDPKLPEWKRVLEELVDYPVDKNGLMVGANVSFQRSHRHWSHMLMVFPLYHLNLDQESNAELVRKTIKHWLSVNDGRQIYGWSRAAASCLYSTLGDGDQALDSLLKHHNHKRFVMPNTMYIEGSPVIECSLFAAKSLQDMLIQSWGNCIRVFPALPSKWNNVTIHNLRAEGAFLVSASRKNGKTQWVRVKSLAGEPCRIRPSIEGDVRLRKDGKLIKAAPSKEGVFEIALEKGEEVLLFSGSQVPDLSVIPVFIDPKEHNAWGIKEDL